MAEKRIIGNTRDKFDVWRMTQAGGYMTFVGGKTYFVFPNHQSFQKYLALNTERSKRHGA